jgi:hypothetical protein
MPLGFTNTFLFQVGGSAYDLRSVYLVADHPTDPASVNVMFAAYPGTPIRLPRAAFEAAYSAALVALG